MNNGAKDCTASFWFEGFLFSLQAQDIYQNSFHLRNDRRSWVKAIYRHPEAADILLESISQKTPAEFITFVDCGCTESYTPVLRGFKQKCMGTERARAIKTQLEKSMQNKAEGLCSEHCTVASKGPESCLIAMA